jgi:hypothetical protein
MDEAWGCEVAMIEQWREAYVAYAKLSRVSSADPTHLAAMKEELLGMDRMLRAFGIRPSAIVAELGLGQLNE